MRRQIEFSVIIPLSNGQGDELACVQSWTHGQNFPRQRYQVLLATTGENPEFDAQAEGLLGAGDRMVHSAGSVQQLFHDAARQAAGSVLFFTELHCIADPGCLTALHDWLQRNPGMAGACAGVSYSNPTPTAALVQQVFEKQAAEWFQPGHWRRVLIRGTALRRTAYDAAGGFEGELSAFADVVLAARFHRLGLRIGLAEDARITHINEARLEEVLSDGRDYALGEHRFRLRAEAVEWEEYLGAAEPWAGVRTERRQRTGQEVRYLARLLGWSPRPNLAVLQLMAGKLLAALVGPRWRRWSLRAAMAWAHLRVRLPGILANRQRAFEELWNLEIQHELVRLALATAHAGNDAALPPGNHGAAQAAWTAWDGIYSLEQEQGRRFRWTRPTFRLRWQLPAGETNWQVMIACGPPCRSPGARLLGAFWNGHKIAATDIQVEGDRLRFRVGSAAEGVNELFVVCRPLIPWWHGNRDPRRLGLPVARLECLPLTDALRYAA
jgi:hypothetical protein